MEIRPGLSLLQVLSRASESKAAPFAERLAELRGEAATTAKPAASAPPGAEPNRPAPAGGFAAGPGRARGSVIDILV